MKTSLHVLGEHNGTKTELYRTNTKSQGLVPSMIISIVVHVVKHQSVLYAKAGEPENDAGFPKHNYSQLNCSCYSYLSKPIYIDYSVFLGCTSVISKRLLTQLTHPYSNSACEPYVHFTCTSYVLNAYLYCVYALVGGAISIRDLYICAVSRVCAKESHAVFHRPVVCAVKT